MLKTYIVAVLLCLASVAAFAQTDLAQKNRPKTATQFDRAPIFLRQPTAQRLRALRSSRDYNYQRATPPPNNASGKFWDWFARKLSDFFGGNSYENFWQYVVIVAFASAALWLVWKAEFLGSFFKSPTKTTLQYETLNENIHELNFAALIEQAAEAGNYRLAVRLYYLKTLKQLTDKNHIQWQPTKTNRSYVFELNNSTLKPDFEILTQQFEYVWYGDFAVSKQNFEEIKTQFQTFSESV